MSREDDIIERLDEATALLARIADAIEKNQAEALKRLERMFFDQPDEPPLIDGCRIVHRGDGFDVCRVHHRYWKSGSEMCPGKRVIS